MTQQLNLSRAALNDLEDALMALKIQIAPKNPDLFEAVAKTYKKDIKKIREEIDTLIGLKE